MRYFLVVGNVHSNNFTGNANLCIINSEDKMPSNNYMKEAIMNQVQPGISHEIKPDDVCIMNIIEFKNEEDFKSYNKK